MERTDLKFKDEIPLSRRDEIAIGSPLYLKGSDSKNAELGLYSVSLNTEIRRLIKSGSSSSAVQRLGKRLLDLFGATLAMLLLSPLVILLGTLIKFDSQGPIFYSQMRVGKDGRLFRFYKFRTMIPNADALKVSLMHKNEADGPAFKMKNDPRVTRLGKFLRKSSLDELPQLWNVFRGEMSLVGPRPALPSEVALWESWQFQRLAVEQGCTCIWQVSGRSDINFQQWMRMDLEYVETWSLLGDITLILRTIIVMLSGRGAY